MASASNSQVVELLQTEFPEIDRINIEETLEACGGGPFVDEDAFIKAVGPHAESRHHK